MRALPIFVALVAIALLAAPALATDMTIPIGKDYTSVYQNGEMVVHVIQVSITDKYMGNTYSADPDNTIWPKVVFQYENTGTSPLTGNFYIAFTDANGNLYLDKNKKPYTDITMNEIQPGQKSDVRFLEAAVPKDVKVTQVVIYDEGLKERMRIDIPYGQAVTPTSTPGSSPSICALPAVLPFLVIGALFLGRTKR